MIKPKLLKVCGIIYVEIYKMVFCPSQVTLLKEDLLLILLYLLCRKFMENSSHVPWGCKFTYTFPLSYVGFLGVLFYSSVGARLIDVMVRCDERA